MNKIITIVALMLASSTVFANCEPVDKLSVVTTISAVAHVSASLIAPGVYVTGESWDTKLGRTNGALHYRLIGEQEPWSTMYNASFAGGCTKIKPRQ
jgi:hypothetical protein